MTAIEARFYDGKTSQARTVLLYPDPPGLRVVGEAIDFNQPLADIRPSARVGDTPRHLYFSDGSQCETRDNDAIDALFDSMQVRSSRRLIHLWESRLRYVALALVLTAVMVWAGIAYGIPLLAKSIAFSMPAASEKALGRHALEGLDKMLLRPSGLAPSRQEQLRALFADMSAAIEGAGAYRLELRASTRIGANAFALPSGIVVVTDALVELAGSDEEIVTVLAHEIGHLRKRHQLRRLLQDSATVLLVIAVTGDIGSTASLAAALPTVLVQARYSREFEREADDFTLQYLESRGVDASALGNMLLRMEKATGGEGRIPDYLSSHPATSERLERFRQARRP